MEKKNCQQLGLYYLENSKLPTKSSFVEKNGQNWYYIIQKIIEDPPLLAMCSVYFRNKLPTGLPVHLMPFSIRVTSCQYELAVIFTCRLCIDIAMSNQHVISFCEYSDNRYFRQSITALMFIEVNKGPHKNGIWAGFGCHLRMPALNSEAL